MSTSLKRRNSLASRLRRRARFLALLLGTALPPAGQAFAQTLYWSATASGTNAGSWGTASNWSPNQAGGGTGVVPVIANSVVFSTTGNNSAKTIELGATRAADGITVNATSTITLRSNATGTTVRNLTIGTGGITVNSGGIVMVTTTGQTNTLLLGSQTWTNNSATALNWNSRVIGQESTVFVKSGTGTVNLQGNNGATAATINGETVTGLRGKIIVSQGILAAGAANALGIRDAQVTVLNSSELPTLVSDTVVQNGATLNTNNQTIGAEFVTFEGTGVGGLGAIVNNSTTTGNTNAVLPQVRMSGPATIGGATARFDFRAGTEQEGRFFQDGFTLTKTGGNTIGFVNTLVQGGGDINIAQGALKFEASTDLMGPGTVTVNSGASIGFFSNTGSITRPIVLNGGARLFHDSNDFISNVNSNISVTGAGVTFEVTDNNNATQQGTLRLNGQLNSAQNLIKTGSGRLEVTLDPASFTGSTIDIQGGSVDLNTTGAGIAANINVAQTGAPLIGTVLGTVFRTGIGGEGKTSGTLTFNGDGQSGGGNNRLQFDANTNGVDQYLRVGAVNTNFNTVTVGLKGPAAPGTGIVVFESAAGGINASEYAFDGRGALSNTGDNKQLLLNFTPASLVWRGTDATNPGIWEVGNSTNWLNGANPDVFLEADFVTFDDSVGAGPTLITPNNSVSPGGIVFNNNLVDYTIVGSTAGVISAGQVGLTKSGTGSLTIATAVGGQGHVFGNTTLNAGKLTVLSVPTGPAQVYGNTTINGGLMDIVLDNPLNTATASLTTPVLGFGGSTTINNGGSLRSTNNINNSGFGANPVAVNTGGTLEFIRGSVPNGTNTAPASAALTNVFSGGGDIIMRGIMDTSPITSFVDSYGQYTINQDNAGFNGRWVLDNARIVVDNGSGDELGGAQVVAPAGSTVLLGGASAVYEGNVFRIAGSGWAFEPSQASGGLGALRFNAATPTIGSTSSVILEANNTRITAQNQTARILGTIDDGVNSFALEIGSPTATQNGNLVLGGANTYGGGTNIENHQVMANNNAAFGTGAINLNGYTSARLTQLQVGNGVNIANPINVSTFAGQGNARGAIEGGRNLQVTDLGAGLGEVSGPITINGTQVLNWAHFSAGEGANSALRVSGPVSAPLGTIVQARSANAGGYVEFGGGGTYDRFEVATGTVRLSANNGLASGTELITRRIADSANGSGVFDTRNFDQTVSSVSRSGTLTTANFSLVNTGTGTSTLTILGTADSDIQNIPAVPGGGSVNIVKNGPGTLILSGTTAGLTGTGTYTVNGGDFSVAVGQTAAGTLVLNGGRFLAGGTVAKLDQTGGVIAGNGTVSGDSSVNSGGFAPGLSPGQFNFGGNLSISGASYFDWEILTASGGTAPDLPTGPLGVPGTDYDVVSIAGSLDLSGLNSFSVNVMGLSALPNTIGIVSGFDPNLNYEWMLFDTANAIVGFDAADFTVNTANFSPSNPGLPGSTFSVGLANNGSDLVLRYTAVPEPSSLMLLVTGLGVSVMVRRRRNS